ncbi:MAG: hypothetical protein [Escherichia phage RP3]|uniref:Uncharacterized protein n=5 Tax=Felixounavirus TaxID=1198140 RepID=A0A7S9XEM9_9CAUD|nr:hypothetical protein GECvBB1_gp054c [Salmonella phage GEC_vB_B1]QPI14243.1 hypothetical protein GECvBBS_gp054c [Salmonella phage GEC_vB_BS]QPI15689.1 hypothetical protein GECvBNS7_gp054c [Salmonella phage GEC_vB_NS7]UKH47915.1 MAG: hypothetical protein [Escherichia phage RP3]WVH07196.1 hypothetical protein JRYRANMO_CDS_0047 [Salmonella phage FM4b]
MIVKNFFKIFFSILEKLSFRFYVEHIKGYQTHCQYPF